MPGGRDSIAGVRGHDDVYAISSLTDLLILADLVIVFETVVAISYFQEL